MRVCGISTMETEPGTSSVSDYSRESLKRKLVETANSENEEQSSEEEIEGTVEKENCSPNVIGRSSRSEYRKKIEGGEQNYLSDLLQRSFAGKCLIIEYNKCAALSDKSSRMLCDIIVSDLINDCESFLKEDDYLDIRNEIKKLFPNEDGTIYYIPSVKKAQSKDDKSHKAKGRLIDAFKNKLQLYRRMIGYNKSSISSKELLLNYVDNVNSPETILASLMWLEHNFEPWDDVKHHWKITAVHRYNELVNVCDKEKQINDYFNRYSVLTNALGYYLIDIDFNLLFSDLDILNLWEPFFQKILTLTKGTKTIQGTLKLLKEEDLSIRCREFLQLFILPQLVPPRSSFRSKILKKNWKPSTIESQEGFVVHITNHGDIETFHAQKCDKMRRLGFTVQPYIIGVGDTLKTVHSFYIIVDKVRYRFTSALKALDICHKLFHVFHTSYPVESEQVWLLLQLGLYKLETTYDNPKPHISKLLQQLSL